MAVIAWAGALTLPAYGASPAAGAPSALSAPGQQGGQRGRAAKQRFDQKGRQAPGEVAGWWVDEGTGQLVVNVVGGRTRQSDAFTADQDQNAVRVDTNSAPVRPLVNLVGGQAITTSVGGRCSIGFSTRRGSAVYVLTAGHCTDIGGTWSGFNGQRIGPVAASNFPTDDFGAISRANAAWVPTGQVQGGPVVRGAAAAAIGAQVCRSGSTTGYRCGNVQARDQTVNYGGGDVVFGLTRTSACAEPGDSGGSFVTPAGQAQGMTSGGSGNCTVGGTTFFQPVVEALQRYGLTLVTG